MVEEKGFLARWSRRKLEQAEADDDEVAAEAGLSDEVVDPEQIDDGSDEEPEDFDPETLPPEVRDIDIATLDYNSDFTVFMRNDVPKWLRRKALRKLWRSNPVLANLDGLNDYDEDYTDAAMVVPDVKTAWRVGRGYLLDDLPAEEPAAEDGEGLVSATSADGVDGVQPDVAETTEAVPDDRSDDALTMAASEDEDAEDRT